MIAVYIDIILLMFGNSDHHGDHHLIIMIM